MTTAVHYRRTDPSTSKEAAAALEASGLAKSQRDLCLMAVKKWPGLTSAEIAAKLNLDDRYIVSRRLPELRDEHLVCNGAKRICTIQKRKVLTWREAPDPGTLTAADVERINAAFDRQPKQIDGREILMNHARDRASRTEHLNLETK